MRTRIFSFFKYAQVIATLTLLLSLLPHAVAQSNKSQVVYLPDPTPREKDPRLLYPETPPGDQQLQGQQNMKRRQLVEWAANELVLLSQQLQTDVAKHPTGTSMAPYVANAEKIEQLAKNLKAAVKAH
jgi:hypothetical protein